jgi:hypothetical protein
LRSAPIYAGFRQAFSLKTKTSTIAQGGAAPAWAGFLQAFGLKSSRVERQVSLFQLKTWQTFREWGHSACKSLFVEKATF